MDTNFQNSTEIQSKLRKIQGKEVILSGTGISWFCNPDVLFSLKRFDGITTTDIVVAMAMFQHSASSRYYPTFQITLKTLAKKCFVTERQVNRSVQRLIVLKVISCVSDTQTGNTYSWNEHFLSTGEIHSDKFSVGQVKNFHLSTENFSLDEVKNCHDLYIDFLFKQSLNIYKEYFSAHHLVFTSYSPSKRTKKDTPQGSGVTVTQSREEAWRSAIDKVSWELIQRGHNGYVRTYLAMVSGKFQACTKFPRPYLLKLAMDEALQWETFKKSEIQFYLHDDESFKNYIDMKTGRNLTKEESHV